MMKNVSLLTASQQSPTLETDIRMHNPKTTNKKTGTETSLDLSVHHMIEMVSWLRFKTMLHHI